MKDRLEQIKKDALAQIEAADALEKLNDVKVKYLGKKGELTAVLKSMKDVAPEDRRKSDRWSMRRERSSKRCWKRQKRRWRKRSERKS